MRKPRFFLIAHGCKLKITATLSRSLIFMGAGDWWVLAAQRARRPVLLTYAKPLGISPTGADVLTFCNVLANRPGNVNTSFGPGEPR
jgi:hypothetical protein